MRHIKLRAQNYKKFMEDHVIMSLVIIRFDLIPVSIDFYLIE